jgi:hypothetical protein
VLQRELVEDIVGEPNLRSEAIGLMLKRKVVNLEEV